MRGIDFAPLLALVSLMSLNATAQTPTQAYSGPTVGDISAQTFDVNAQTQALMARSRGFNFAACGAGGPSSTGPGSAFQSSELISSADRTLREALRLGLEGNGAPQSCINVAGQCPEVTFDTNQQFSCDMWRGSDGMFSQTAWNRTASELRSAVCASECRAGAADEALNQMGCLREQMEAMETSMEGMRADLERNIELQQQYVQHIDRAIEQEEQQKSTLVGPNGEGGIKANLVQQAERLQSLIQGQESGIQPCVQAVREYQQNQQLYTQAIQRATTERAASCFLAGKPRGMAITPIFRGGPVPSSMMEWILGRYEQSLWGTTTPSNIVRDNARNRVAELRSRIESELAEFRGEGRVSMTAATATGQQRGRGVEAMRALVESVIAQTGNQGNIADWLRRLERQCTAQAQSDINREVAATGSEAFNIRRDMERQGIALMSGGEGGGCGQGGLTGAVRQYSDTVRGALTSLYGQQAGNGWNPTECTSVAVRNNQGNTRIVNSSLNRAVSCVQGLQNIADGILNGTAIGGQAVQAQNLPVQVNPPISCAGLRACIGAVEQRVGLIDARIQSMAGSATFPDPKCPGGQCPGKRKFIAEAARATRNAVTAASRHFSQQMAALDSQLRTINGRLTALGLSTVQLDRMRPTDANWQCGEGPNPDRLCETPENMAMVLGARTTPPGFVDGPRALADRINDLQSDRERLREQSRSIASRSADLDSKKAECQRRGQAARLRQKCNQLDALISSCEAEAIDRDALCGPGSRVHELRASVRSIENEIGIIGEGEESPNCDSVESRLDRLCNERRRPGRSTASSGCMSPGERSAAEEAEICGARPRAFIPIGADADSALQTAEARIANSLSGGRYGLRINETDRGFCIMPCEGDNCMACSGEFAGLVYRGIASDNRPKCCAEDDNGRIIAHDRDHPECTASPASQLASDDTTPEREPADEQPAGQPEQPTQPTVTAGASGAGSGTPGGTAGGGSGSIQICNGAGSCTSGDRSAFRDRGNGIYSDAQGNIYTISPDGSAMNRSEAVANELALNQALSGCTGTECNARRREYFSRFGIPTDRQGVPTSRQGNQCPNSTDVYTRIGNDIICAPPAATPPRRRARTQ